MRLPWRTPPADPGPAEAVLSAAVMLGAGVAPERVWILLAEAGDAGATRVAARIAEGATVADALDEQGESWRAVASAWRVATAAGSSLSSGLRTLVSSLSDHDEIRAEAAVALAEPAMTARVLQWMPLAGLLLGLGLGFDTLHVLLRTPIGGACGVAGIVLIAVGRTWTRRLMARATAPGGIPGFEAELLAIALSGGMSLPRARELVTVNLPPSGAGRGPPGGGPRPRRGSSRADPARRLRHPGLASHGDPLAPAPEDSGRISGILALAERAGVPAAELLRQFAAGERRRARAEGRSRAARLGTTLLLPLAVCVLPAFLLLGIVPLLLAVLSVTGLGGSLL